MVANGLEGVPWMISGADHSADVARVLAYAATAGTSGIISPGDLKVVPSGTANMQVHMGVGAFAVVNKSGGVQSQSYVGRGTAVSDITVATTGSSARSDLVVVRVKDPQFAPYQGLYTNPTDIANGPYAFPEIIPGVAANTVRAEQLGLPQSLYAVARIDVPANTTSGITSGMIKDLRQLVAPHSSRVLAQQSGTTWGEYLNIGDTAWKNWPVNALSVDVPSWATNAFVTLTLNTVATDAIASDFNPRINFGGLTFQSAAWDYNGAPAGAGGSKLPFTMFADLDVTSLAGQTGVLVRPQAMRTWTTNTGQVWFDPNSQIIFDIVFQQRPL